MRRSRKAEDLAPSPDGERWLTPDRLDYLPVGQDLAVLRLLGRVERRVPPPASPSLVLGTPHSIVRGPALGNVTHQSSRRRRTADHLLWRVTFALPLDLVECPGALFGIVARGYLPTRLPDARLTDLATLCEPWEVATVLQALSGMVGWRRAAALGTAVAVAGTSVLPPAAALASAGHPVKTHRPHHPVHHRHPRTPAQAKKSAHAHLSGVLVLPGHGSSTTTYQAGSLTVSTGPHSEVHKAGAHRLHHHQDPGSAHHLSAHPGSPATGAGASPGGGQAAPSSSQVSSSPAPAWHPSHRHHPQVTVGTGRRAHRYHVLPPGASSGDGFSSLTTTPPVGLLTTPTDRDGSHHHHHPGAAEHHHHHRGAAEHHHGGTSHKPHKADKPHRAHKTHKAHKPAVKPPTPNPADNDSDGTSTSTTTGSSTPGSFWTDGLGTNPQEAALLNHLFGLSAKVDKPPSFLIPIYKRAGARFHIPWQVLAAINSIETDYGRNLNVSSAGAVGWMQFMPSTWREYGMSVGGHGTPNPYDPTDAIFSAARYLAANGGAHHLRKAIFAYNHAVWYVDEVMWRADQILEHTARPNASAKSKIAAMKNAAELLNGLPYIYGGGHGGWGPQLGYDCSGFVSAVLHAAGYLDAPQDTQTLPDQPGIMPGPGKWVTMFDRTDGGALTEDHVIIDIDGHFWESGGSTSDGGGPRVHQIKHISLGYLATFNRILHPKGL